MSALAFAPPKGGSPRLILSIKTSISPEAAPAVDNIHLMKEYPRPPTPGLPKHGRAQPTTQVCNTVGVTGVPTVGVGGDLCRDMAMSEGVGLAAPRLALMSADFVTTKLPAMRSPPNWPACAKASRSAAGPGSHAGGCRPGHDGLELAPASPSTCSTGTGRAKAHAVSSFGGRRRQGLSSHPPAEREERHHRVQPRSPRRRNSHLIERPLCLSRITDRQRWLIEFGLDMRHPNRDWVLAAWSPARSPYARRNASRPRANDGATCAGPARASAGGGRAALDGTG